MSDFQEKINFLIHRLYFRMLTIEKELSSDARFGGLTVTQIHCVLLVTERPCALKELSAELCLTKGPTSLMVKRLEADGYIWTEPDAADRRSVRIGATAKGRAFVRIHDSIHAAAVSMLVEKLTDDEKAQLVAIFNKFSVSEMTSSIPTPMA